MTETVSDLAHAVADLTPEVPHRVGDAAHRLAAKTPWVDDPQPTRDVRRWLLNLAALAVIGVIAWWWLRRDSPSAPDQAESAWDGADNHTGQRRVSAVAN